MGLSRFVLVLGAVGLVWRALRPPLVYEGPFGERVFSESRGLLPQGVDYPLLFIHLSVILVATVLLAIAFYRSERRKAPWQRWAEGEDDEVAASPQAATG